MTKLTLIRGGMYGKPPASRPKPKELFDYLTAKPEPSRDFAVVTPEPVDKKVRTS